MIRSWATVPLFVTFSMTGPGAAMKLPLILNSLKPTSIVVVRVVAVPLSFFQTATAPIVAMGIEITG